MIKLEELKCSDIGRWVRYRAHHDAIEWGRLKSWNDKFIFVVYGWAGEQSFCQNYTAASTEPKDLEFNMELENEVLQAWGKKIKNMTHQDMAILYRFAPSEFEVFRNYILWKFFTSEFLIRGATTKEIVTKIDEIPKEVLKEMLSDLTARPSISARSGTLQPPPGTERRE
ncbi:MAG: hypothetical protein WC750_06185 [Patescibacteria group bacterium]|jgi:hypothetical protein